MDTMVDPRDLVSQAEAARLAGLSLAGFKYLRHEAPQPIRVAGRPLWLRHEVEEWAATRAAQRP
jgi:hypothetical protein